MKRMGARNAGNPHVACDVEGAGDVAWPRRLGLDRRASPRPYAMVIPPVIFWKTRNYRDRISWSEAATGPPQRLSQNIQVADVVGEQQDQLGVHHLALFQGKIPVRVNEGFVKVVRLGDDRFNVERHDQ